MNFTKLYKDNQKFHDYVDRCAKGHKENPMETIKRLTVQEVGKMYAGEPEETVKEIPKKEETQTINIIYGGGC
jgi:hypothetical protein